VRKKTEFPNWEIAGRSTDFSNDCNIGKEYTWLDAFDAS
jgi:hypothetical protein